MQQQLHFLLSYECPIETKENVGAPNFNAARPTREREREGE